MGFKTQIGGTGTGTWTGGRRRRVLGFRLVVICEGYVGGPVLSFLALSLSLF